MKKGHDPRRHLFTPTDCRVGWLVANILHPHLREWLKMRLRVYYHRRKNGTQEEGGTDNGPANGTHAGDEWIPF